MIAEPRRTKHRRLLEMTESVYQDDHGRWVHGVHLIIADTLNDTNGEEHVGQWLTPQEAAVLREAADAGGADTWPVLP